MISAIMGNGTFQVIVVTSKHVKSQIIISHVSYCLQYLINLFSLGQEEVKPRIIMATSRSEKEREPLLPQYPHF